MKFYFDPNLDYQVNAIQAVVRLCEGALDPEARRGAENVRITCAKVHFDALGVDYADVVTADALP
jgi:restriction endonuclease